MSEDVMARTCTLCPFSRTKTLGLHPKRAEDFAYMASNRYSDFPCHKTAVYHESDDDYLGESGFYRGENSKTCHGFYTLQCAENESDEDFKPDGDGFEDTYEMIDRHIALWEEKNGPYEEEE